MDIEVAAPIKVKPEPETLEIRIEDVLGSPDVDENYHQNRNLKNLEFNPERIKSFLGENEDDLQMISAQRIKAEPKSTGESGSIVAQVNDQVFEKGQQSGFKKYLQIRIPKYAENDKTKIKVEITENLQVPKGPECFEDQRQQVIPESDASVKDFSLYENESLVLNFANTTEGIKIAKKPRDCVYEYKTNEMTNLAEDLSKVIVIPAANGSNIVQKHEYTVVDRAKYVCNYCQSASSQKGDIKKHIKTQHRENCRKLKCPFCTYVCKNGIKDMRIHILYKHKSEGEVNWYICNECNHKSKTKEDLRKHLRVHASKEQLHSKHKSEDEVNWYICNECNHNSRTKAALIKHLRVHASKEQLHGTLHYCQVCNKGFKCSEHVRRHVKYVHNKEEKKRLKCDQCDFHCHFLGALTHHIEGFHTKLEDLPLLKCKECSYTTRYSETFQRHEKKHKIQYCCEKCGFKTRSQASFKLHEIYHKKDLDDGHLNLQCDQCDYKTYRTHSLQMHKLNHLQPHEIQYFYCYHCDFKAKRKDNLKTHIQRHFKNNEVSFPCYLCKFTTRTRETIFKHLDRHANAGS